MERFVVPNLQNPDVHVRKACYLAMAVVAEGCSEYIRHRHIDSLISYVMNGLKDPAMPVNNAALFAIGQFSEHLQVRLSVIPNLTPWHHISQRKVSGLGHKTLVEN